MASKKISNFFFCREENQSCEVDFLGNTNCGYCEKRNKCEFCARKDSPKCEKCLILVGEDVEQ